jgi:hypothetical protein
VDAGIGAPDALSALRDAEIVALLQLRAHYRVARYVVTHSATEHPKWRPASHVRPPSRENQ